jgi:hypothetical protein
VSRLRWALVALLVASTALLAVGASLERSEGDTHVEPASAEAAETGAEPEGAHSESGEGHTEPAGEAEAENERVLGVDLESTPSIVIAVVAGLALAGLTTSRLGRLPGFLLAVAAIALAWAALDVREVVHQLDESHTGIALVAIGVAALHLAAAAVSGRLFQRARASPP